MRYAPPGRTNCRLACVFHLSTGSREDGAWKTLLPSRNLSDPRIAILLIVHQEATHPFRISMLALVTRPGSPLISAAKRVLKRWRWGRSPRPDRRKRSSALDRRIWWRWLVAFYTIRIGFGMLLMNSAPRRRLHRNTLEAIRACKVSRFQVIRQRQNKCVKRRVLALLTPLIYWPVNWKATVPSAING